MLNYASVYINRNHQYPIFLLTNLFTMAYIHIPFNLGKVYLKTTTTTSSVCNSSQPTMTVSRRRALTLLTASISSMLLNDTMIVNAEEKPQLPPGAQQFNRLLAAQKQWSELSQVVNSNRTLDENEWDTLRQYLRTVYGVSNDMEFLAKPWEKSIKSRASTTIKQFRQVVKGMDKPAIARDIKEFAQGHLQTTQLFNEFFTEFKEATVSDIPDEL